MSTIYELTFSRIGRHHDVPPLRANANDADDLAAKVHRYARQYLGSRDVVVTVDLGEMKGAIWAGPRNGGDFTIEKPHQITLSPRDERAIANVLVQAHGNRRSA